MDIVLHVEINDKFPRIREACEFSVRVPTF